ncbi:hypothetical protein F5Y12DRAFT_789895 [Xylaria sp. FL1777]|nr:hypothetical protein F5Y12DRAFT_789895 [Xylaria sp. FL1777]
MPSRRQLTAMIPANVNPHEREKAERAARKEIRTSWRTDATEQEKETALRLAINKMGGGKKYSWLQQGPKTVAETLGQKRAVELGIKTGKLAKELKIGEYRGEDGGPRHLAVNWEELRGAGINMTKEEFEKAQRDAGISEEEIRASLSPIQTKIVGRSAASVRERSAEVIASVEDTPATPTKSRGRKRAATEDDDEVTATPTQKRKRKMVATPVVALATPPASSSPQTQGSSPARALVLDETDNEPGNETDNETDDVPSFAPRSPSVSELEALLQEE